tara:strand:- start:152 stop:439 length:288 start_codon:yes stop_codon:yes gene_type:complete
MFCTVFQKDRYDAIKVVASVEVETTNEQEALNEAYSLTQTVNRCWWQNDGVMSLFSGDGCPSTSVGDIIATPSAFYQVEPVGFAKIEDITKIINF